MSRKSHFRPAAERTVAAFRATAARPQRAVYRRQLKFESLEDRRVLSAVTVTTLEDKVDFNDGLTSLREAIFATNLVSGADEITFAPALTASGAKSIVLTQGELKITDALTITGPGAELLTIDASGSDPTPTQNKGDGSRVFNIDDGLAATFFDTTISGLTLTGGDLYVGSAIRSLENLVLDETVVANNSARMSTIGATIVSAGGRLEVRDSRITDNEGIAIVQTAGQLTLRASRLSGNFGGVRATGDTTVIDSHIVDNFGYFTPTSIRGYAGINVTKGIVLVERSTITGNQGGGLLVGDGSLTIVDSSVSQNSLFGISGSFSNGAAGISTANTSVTIVNCEVSANDARPRFPSPTQSFVGGIRITGGRVSISHTQIVGNIGGDGLSITGPVTAATVTDTAILDNASRGVTLRSIIEPIVFQNVEISRNGSGMYGLINKLTLEDCTITNNRGTGVIVNTGRSSPPVEIVRCDISRNVGQGVGGIFLRNGKIIIRDSTIDGNQSVQPITFGGQIYPAQGSAGGIFIGEPLGTPDEAVIENSSIRDNKSFDDGGGISITEGALLTVRNSVISGNEAVGQGGGIYARQFSSKLYIFNSTLSENSAASGGGISALGRLTIADSIVASNSATAIGAGISVSLFQLADIRRCQIINNVGGTYGGGIFSQGNVTIADCTIAGNSAVRGGGVAAYSGGGCTIIDSTINGNSADLGGGVWSLNFPVAITQSTISGNSAVDGGGVFGLANINHSTIAFNSVTGNGGGFFAPRGTSTIRNSIIAKNTIANSSGLPPGQMDLAGLIGATFVPSFSLIGTNAASGLAGTAPGMPGANGNLIGGNTIIDPKLGPLADNGGETMPDGSHLLTHALLVGSPAINAGDPALVAGVGGVPVHDQRGAPFTRIFGGRIDIGAFELQPVDVLAGDYDQNGIVDAADYIVWRNTMGANVTPGSGADGNFDGHVDTLDFDVWKNNFGSTTANLPPAIPPDAAALEVLAPIAVVAFAGSDSAPQSVSAPLPPNSLRISDEAPEADATELSVLSSISIVVTTLDDKVDFNDGLTSLREAIFAANTVFGAQEITFAPTLTASGPATLLLTQGEFKITDSVTVAGPGADLLTIDASGSADPPEVDFGDVSRIFNIDDGNATSLIDATITGFTLTNAVSISYGSAIRSTENATLVGLTITGNFAKQLDGAIYSTGPTLHVVDSTISHNVGQGIVVRNGHLTVDRSVISENTPFISGMFTRFGGVSVFRGTAEINDSTIADQSKMVGVTLTQSELSISRSIISGNAGGIAGSGNVTVTDSSIVNNYFTALSIAELAGYGGISLQNGNLSVIRTTISGNYSAGLEQSAGGISFANGALTLVDSTISHNKSFSTDTASAIAATNAQVEIVGCQITNNEIRKTRFGPLQRVKNGVSLYGTTITVTDSIISNNLLGPADFFGDSATALSANGTTVSIVGCTFDSNIGGNGLLAQGDNITIENCVFSDNRGGAGVFTSGGTAVVRDCDFINNGLSVTAQVKAGVVGVGNIIDCTVSGAGGIFASANNGGAINITRATVTGEQNSYGIGITAAGKVTISDSLIENHRNLDTRPTMGGGGIYIGPSGDVLVENTIIRNNSAVNGGAIFVAATGWATIRNSSITGNTADIAGGGIWEQGKISIIGCDISGNSAKLGGGLYLKSTSTFQSALVDLSTITGNTSATDGGGIAVSNIAPGRMDIARSSISQNQAGNRGGGIFGTAFTLTDSTINGNSADAGGGVWTNSNRARITQDTISGNSAVVGGGIFGSTTVDHSTIAFNTATSNGGGVFGDGGVTTLRNTVVSNNLGTLIGTDLTGALGTTFDLHYSLVGTNRTSGLTETPLNAPDASGYLIGGTLGQTVINPLAALADNGGETMPDGSHRLTHALLVGSPAINAGDPSLQAGVGTVPIHDERGAPFTRVFGGRIDMGAFELQPADVLAGDYDRNGAVDTADYTVWRNTMGASGTPGSGADGNFDGHIDTLDFNVWKNNFGSTTANLPLVAPAAAFANKRFVGGSSNKQPSAERVAVSRDRHQRALLSWLEKHNAQPGPIQMQPNDDQFAAGETCTDDFAASDPESTEAMSIDEAFAALT